jgi:tetratricopeptide (TPR) repeat protein
VSEEALHIAEVGDPAYSLVVACLGLGTVLVLQGEVERAASILDRGLHTDPGEPIGRVWPFVASTLGTAYIGLARLDDALPLLEQAVERAVAMKLMANHPLRLVRLAEAHVMAGRPESASPLAARAIDLAQEQRERGHEAYALKLLGDVWAMRDDADQNRAEEHYRKALALAVQLGMRPLQGHCHLGLGRLARRRRDGDAAGAALGAAHDLFQELQMTFWLRQLEAVARGW